MLLTYEEYKTLGGRVNAEAFPNLERRAERKLSYYTQERTEHLTKVPDSVKELLTLYVDKINGYDERGGVSSYSNGTESLSYSEPTRADEYAELYRLAVEYLPIELISRAVCDGC